jgi:hypothetical protein
MRHLFLILLIALLPLRGAFSDAMAAGMVTAQAHQKIAGELISVQALKDEAQTHQDIETVVSDVSQTAADCSGHASGVDENAGDTHCNSCGDCQACHTVVLFTAAADLNIAFNPSTLPRAVVARFDSAEHALDKKPPIS